MKMVGHKTIGMRLPTGSLARLRQRVQEAPPVLVVVENPFAPVTPVHEVVDGPGY